MVVGYNKEYHWTGTQAGLKYPHRILKANNRSISSMKDLDEVISNTKVGEPVKYLIDREGEIIEVALPTMRFSGADLLTTFGIGFFIGILYLVIGGIVFILKPDTKVSWVFLLACLIQGVSSLMDFDSESTHFVSARVHQFIAAFLPAFVLHLSLLFPEKLKLVERYPRIEAIPYILSTILIIPFQLLYPRPSFMFIYKIIILYINISVLALIASILAAYLKKSSPLSRQRAKVILFGAALALPIPASALLVSFMGGVLGGMKVHAGFSSIPVIIFPATIAYAIARHNLFDVDVYIKRAVGYGVMTGIVGLGYFSMQMVIRSLILQPLFGASAEKVYPFLFALLVVFLFNPIRNRLQKLIDRIFYRLEYDYQETVQRISGTMRYLQNLDQIRQKIVDTILGVMFIDSCGIMLANAEKNAYEGLNISYDYPITKLGLPTHDPLIQEMAEKKKEVTIYDIQEDPSYEKDREAFGKVFDQLKATLILPLVYEDRLIGIMSLGNKKSGKFYRREDINLLKTMANQGAVAIENARLADQMKSEEMVRLNLARYLSPQIVDQVIKKDVQVNLGGDRKVVTILFSDIRNFTRISESMPPDKLVQLLNEYFTEMARIIFENQGSLDKYIGDAIVAVFGSLIPLENSAQTAIQTAIQMMKQMGRLNERWVHQYGLRMEMGIGINTGEVFLGNVGSPERMEFTVIGDTVNIASRFSGVAQGGQILITKDTLARLGSDIKYKELEPIEVKGKTGKLEVFEIPY
jgi:class 3 adenylate cyclase